MMILPSLAVFGTLALLAVALLALTVVLGVADPGTVGSFGDFMLATRQRPLSGPDKISNQMTRHRRYMSRVMTSGLGQDLLFQDGTEIVEFVQVSYTPNARNYIPTADQTPTGENSLQQIKIPWRFTIVDSVWYDHEIILNNGDERTVFKRLAKVKRQKMFTDLWDKVEDDNWALPNSSSMEGGNSSGADPYSLLCFNTRNGGAPTSTNGGVASGTSDWTTVETLSPTTYTNWANQYETYDSSDAEGNIEDALNRMWIKVQFESPDDGAGKTGMEDTEISKYMITTNLEGYTLLLKLVKNSNNVQDPKTALGWANGKITLNGMPIRYLDSLDSTSVVPTGKPDFIFWDFNNIRPVFHKTRYLFAKSFEGTVRQPMANAEFRDTWRNTVCTNRRQQGRVSAA